MKKLIAIIGVVVVSSIQANTFPTETQIVGYVANKQTIQSVGWYSVQLLFNPIGFSGSMDGVIKFRPTNDVIGDELEFSHEGEVRIYRIIAFKDGAYQLRSTAGEDEKIVTFKDIPFQKKFNFHHRSKKPVSVEGKGVPRRTKDNKVTNELVEIKKLMNRK